VQGRVRRGRLVGYRRRREEEAEGKQGERKGG